MNRVMSPKSVQRQAPKATEPASSSSSSSASASSFVDLPTTSESSVCTSSAALLRTCLKTGIGRTLELNALAERLRFFQWFDRRRGPVAKRQPCLNWRLLLSLFFIFLQLCTVSATKKRCASCSVDTFEEYKQFRQQQILNDLLRKLELAAKPNVTIDYDNLPPMSKNPRIKALIEQTIREKKRARRSLTKPGGYVPALYQTDANVPPQVTFLMAESAPWPIGEAIDIALFNINPSLRKKYIHRASLHVYVRRPPVFAEQMPLRIDVYERFLNGTLGDKIATKFQLIHGEREVVPVSIPLEGMDVQNWLQMQLENHEQPAVGLYVEALFDEDNLVYFPRDNYPENMYLELEVFDMPGRSRRSSPQVCQAGGNETKCCLYDLIIDFEKVGWEFVIAPKRYNAYICNGDCNQMNQNLPLVSTHGSMTAKTQNDFYQCCHPKDYTGVTIVYVTESNQIWVKEVPGMVARKCGCS